MEISISAAGDRRFRIAIAAPQPTCHLVTVPPGFLETLGLPHLPPERVIEESFRFLLERELNTQILDRFSLPVIERYFPSYPEEMRRRLGTSQAAHEGGSHQ